MNLNLPNPNGVRSQVTPYPVSSIGESRTRTFLAENQVLSLAGLPFPHDAMLFFVVMFTLFVRPAGVEPAISTLSGYKRVISPLPQPFGSGREKLKMSLPVTICAYQNAFV